MLKLSREQLCQVDFFPAHPRKNTDAKNDDFSSIKITPSLANLLKQQTSIQGLQGLTGF
jgi:hypothetical protein